MTHAINADDDNDDYDDDGAMKIMIPILIMMTTMIWGTCTINAGDDNDDDDDDVVKHIVTFTSIMAVDVEHVYTGNHADNGDVDNLNDDRNDNDDDAVNGRKGVGDDEDVNDVGAHM